MGKATLADLATSQDGKDLLRRRSIKEVIVYDDAATDCERLPSNSALYIVLSALIEDHKEPLLLAGTTHTLKFNSIIQFHHLISSNLAEIALNGEKFAQNLQENE